MTSIEVTLEDQHGVMLHRAKIADNAEISRLMPMLITSLRLPITDDAGRPIRYHLSYNGARLPPEQTLAGAEVQNGETLVIVPEMTAGAQSETRDDQLLDPLVMLEPDEEPPPVIPAFPTDYKVDVQTSTVLVTFQPGTLQQVLEQARKQSSEEVAGIMLGNVYSDGRRFLVEVEQALEAHYTNAGSSFVTFTEQTWLDLLQQRRATSLSVVGWYHSHPSFGIFLSQSDRFIQQHFFRNRLWYIALVVDPTTSDWGVFAWEADSIQRCTKTLAQASQG